MSFRMGFDLHASGEVYHWYRLAAQIDHPENVVRRVWERSDLSEIHDLPHI